MHKRQQIKLNNWSISFGKTMGYDYKPKAEERQHQDSGVKTRTHSRGDNNYVHYSLVKRNGQSNLYMLRPKTSKM